MATVRTRGQQTITSESSPEEIENFYTFIQSTIQRYGDLAVVGRDSQNLTFVELNDALQAWERVWLGITGLKTQAKVELAHKNEEFENWFANRYIILRNELNPRTLQTSKWYSQKEVEMEVRVKFADEMNAWKKELILLEQKVEFLRRVSDGWDGHRWNLSALSKNLQAEAGAIGMGTDLN